jgi:DinB family protein
MTLRDALIREFDLELPFTRRSLERVPIDKFAWKPHEKSMTLGWLATFLALVPTWGVMAIEKDEFDPTATSGGKRPELPSSMDALLGLFDQNYTALRTALAATTDAHLQTEWTLQPGGQVWFTKPRWLVLREYILNHIVHHRAQLGVYLRLQGIDVPAIYNDSADEKGGVFRDVS